MELSLLQKAVNKVIESAHSKEEIEKHTKLETNKFGYSNSGLLPRHLYYNNDGEYIYHRSEGLWHLSPIFKAITVNPWSFKKSIYTLKSSGGVLTQGCSKAGTP